MGKAVKIDAEGQLRCWNCGSVNLETRRRTGSKAIGAAAGLAVVGPLGLAGALAAKKRLRCQGCGEYNDVGKPEQWQPSSGAPKARPAVAKTSTGKRKQGWYPDPKGAAGMLRFWNGAQWTSDLHPDPN